MATLLKSIGGCATSYPSSYPTAKRSKACRPTAAQRKAAKGRRLKA